MKELMHLENVKTTLKFEKRFPHPFYVFVSISKFRPI